MILMINSNYLPKLQILGMEMCVSYESDGQPLRYQDLLHCLANSADHLPKLSLLMRPLHTTHINIQVAVLVNKKESVKIFMKSM